MKAIISTLLLSRAIATLHGADLPSPVQIEIVAPKFTDVSGLAVVARFTNRSDAVVRIIRPLDGSLDGRIAPYYRITLSDSTGILPLLGPSCGNFGLWANTKWPDDYVILIPPGHTHEVPLFTRFQPRASGQHRVTLEYIMPESPTQPSLLGSRPTYPAEVWRGTTRQGGFNRPQGATEMTPNHALQRTAPRVTLAAADHPATCALPARATFPQPAHPLRLSLSLGSFGDFAHVS